MKKIAFVAVLVLLLYSCTTEIKQHVEKDKNAGGKLKINMAYVPHSLYPPAINDAVSAQVINMFHAGLVKYNSKNLAIMPSIAKKWNIDSTNNVFTFYLRNNAFFHDNECFSGGKGRKVIAQDFVYTFELLCTHDSLNNNFSLLENVVDAVKYNAESKKGKPAQPISGIKAINDSVLQITIEKSNPAFVEILANPALSVLPHEAVEKYGKEQFVGAGPFMIKEKPVKDKKTILSRTENYFLMDGKGIQLPYLDTIQICFNGSSLTELNLFYSGQIDIISGILQSESKKIVSEHIQDFQSNPPKYILGSATEEKVQLYNLLYPYVKEFYTNGINYLDFSIVYFDKTSSDSTKIR